MTRKVKNIILICIVVLSLVSICFTINCFMNNTGDNFNRSVGDRPLVMPNNMRELINRPGGGNGEFRGEMHEKEMSGPWENRNIMNSNDGVINTKYYLIIGIECLVLSCSLIYLIMSNFNKKNVKETFESKDKIVIYVLVNILLVGVFVFGSTVLFNKDNLNPLVSGEQEEEKDKIILDDEIKVQAGTIDLSEYDTDINITESGKYVFSGEFKNSIIVNAEGSDV